VGRIEEKAKALDFTPAVLDALRFACHGVERLEARVRELEGLLRPVADERATVARREEWRQAGDLRGFERKVYSQQGEDGIIEEIFRRIGTTTRFFVEFGVESGVECNCARLAKKDGWAGLFMEANPADFAKLVENYRGHPAVRCEETRVTAATVEALFAEFGVPAEFDLLSIDIDGNDYWVWQALTSYRPRVVVIEYNPFHLPPKKWVMREDPSFRWGKTTYFGASLAALDALGRRKGYTLVGTDSHGVNAFFARDDCLGGHFLDPALHYHFTPFAYPPPPPGDGPAVEG
jgi:hypothetical protein